MIQNSLFLSDFTWEIGYVINLDNCSNEVNVCGVNRKLRYTSVNVQVNTSSHSDETKTLLLMLFDYDEARIKDIIMMEELKSLFGLKTNGYQEVIHGGRKKLAMSGYFYGRKNLRVPFDIDKQPVHRIFEEMSDSEDVETLKEIRKILAFQWLYTCGVEGITDNIIIRKYCPPQSVIYDTEGKIDDMLYDMYFPSLVGEPPPYGCTSMDVVNPERNVLGWFKNSINYFYSFTDNELLKKMGSQELFNVIEEWNPKYIHMGKFIYDKMFFVKMATASWRSTHIQLPVISTPFQSPGDGVNVIDITSQLIEINEYNDDEVWNSTINAKRISRTSSRKAGLIPLSYIADDVTIFQPRLKGVILVEILENLKSIFNVPRTGFQKVIYEGEVALMTYTYNFRFLGGIDIFTGRLDSSKSFLDSSVKEIRKVIAVQWLLCLTNRISDSDVKRVMVRNVEQDPKGPIFPTLTTVPSFYDKLDYTDFSKIITKSVLKNWFDGDYQVLKDVIEKDLLCDRSVEEVNRGFGTLGLRPGTFRYLEWNILDTICKRIEVVRRLQLVPEKLEETESPKGSPEQDPAVLYDIELVGTFGA